MERPLGAVGRRTRAEPLARLHGKEERLVVTAHQRVPETVYAGERPHPRRQRDTRLQRALAAAGDDLRPERHHEAHAEPGGAARIVRARHDPLKAFEGQPVLDRPPPPHLVHEQVTAGIQRRPCSPRARVDPRQLVGRIPRAVDVEEQEADIAGVTRLLEVDLLALPEPGPLRGGGGGSGRDERTGQRDEREGLHAWNLAAVWRPPPPR